MPASPARDLLLLGALLLAGYQLGAFLGDGGAGLACGALAYLLTSYRRLAKLHRWLAEGPLKRDPPVQGGMLGDVADRMQHTHALLQKQLDEADATVVRLRESYAALKDGIVMLGPDNVIEWSNASALALLGLRYPQDVGQALGNLVRDPDFAAYLAQGDFERFFELETGGAAARTMEVQATAFGANRKVIFVRDITGLKRLETMRKDFVANISHELRTPLTVIAGYLDVLEHLLAQDSPVVAKALAQMQQQSVRMENLLRDLMLLSTLEGTEGDDAAAAEESIAVCAMLESIRENALAACGGERHIALECAPGLRLRGPRLQIESIFSNLVFNAVKYTAPGGNIRIVFEADGEHALFRVTDDGIGIDPVHIPRLTERFYRVDKSRSVESGGTGLGLAIVKHALKRVQGELQIESRPGSGSTFSCRFPLQRLSGTKQG
ncbi:MAG: phosphate regulon sensor histidine kinase PhoR [Pseudomonadales bacterium]|nr:phosphate regulon sensor histidine kinase PhoR [Pseudomonadales bacterium]